MMRCVETCDMGLRPSGGRPLGDNRPLGNVDDLDDAFTMHHISHARVQPIGHWVQYDAGWFLTLHLDTANQLGRLGVHNLDGTFFTSFGPGPDTDVIQPLGGVKGGVIWVPAWRVLSTGQLNGLGDLECRSVQGHNGVVTKIHPEFVRIWIKKWFARISANLGFLNHLARFHIYDNNLFVVLRRKK